MKPTKNGGWEYVKATPNKPSSKEATDTDELDDLWEDMDADELDDLEPPGPQLTILLANGDADVMKKLSNNGEENFGMKVQPDGCNKRHLSAPKNKVE